MATGMLVCAINDATKFSSYNILSDKSYTLTMKLGVKSDTYDITGNCYSTNQDYSLDMPVLKSIVDSYLGSFMQVPPAYSALHVNGKRSYDLARSGVAVEHAPRPVELYAAEILDYNLPYIKLTIKCSKGFYVRSLVNDIGDDIGCGAVMTGLHRNYVDPFFGYKLNQFDKVLIGDCEFISADRFTAHLDRIDVSLAQYTDLLFGRFISMQCAYSANSFSCYCNNKFVGIVQGAGDIIKPKKIIKIDIN